MVATPEAVSQSFDSAGGTHATVIMQSTVREPTPQQQRSVSIDVGSVANNSSAGTATGSSSNPSGAPRTSLPPTNQPQSLNDALVNVYNQQRKYSQPTLTAGQSSNGAGFDRPHAPAPVTTNGSCLAQSLAQPAAMISPVQQMLAQQAAAQMLQHSMPQQQQQHHTPNSSDACASIVHSLMCHRKAGDEEFSRCAIQSLIKKLKDKRDELDALIQSVTTSGSVHTKCVTIQRTLDGRLQVATKKGFPHVVYAKIWRWPDLSKNELKHVKYCQYAFDLKLDLVCVNPYHYERVISPGIGNIDISTLRIFEGGMKTEYNNGSGAAENMPGGSRSMLAQAHDHLQQRIMAEAAHAAPTQSSAAGGGATTDSKPKANIDHPRQSAAQPAMIDPMSPLMNHSVWSSQISPLSQPSFQRQSGLDVQQQLPCGIDSMNGQNWNNMNSMFSLPYLQAAGLLMENESIPPLLSTQLPPDYWCSIAYYEMDTQVGETFKVPKNFSDVTVDGFVNPAAPNRFCLGALTNVHRTEKIDNTRMHIGHGIMLSLVNEGDVFVANESKYNIFVQSFYLDREAGRSPGDTVHKIYPKGRIKVFDLQLCYRQMHQRACNAQAAATAQAAAVAGLAGSPPAATSAALASQSGASVDELRRFCIVRLSFVKGWGPDYPQREVITMTPCWIEVHLNRALQLLDEVLHGGAFVNSTANNMRLS